MKKLMCFLLLFIVVLILPINVFAEGEDEGKDSAEAEKAKPEEVLVYFFRGNGCPHCQEAEAWFEGLDKDVKKKFDIVDLETWENTDNAGIMTKVAEARGESETATGVPYIIVGDKSWVGFAEDMTEEILNQIDKVYSQDAKDRYDVFDLIKFTGERNIVDNDGDATEDKGSNDVLTLFVILIVVAGVCFGIYKTRQSV